MNPNKKHNGGSTQVMLLLKISWRLWTWRKMAVVYLQFVHKLLETWNTVN